MAVLSRHGQSSGPAAAATPRAWQCTCGHEIYFRNSECLGCGAPLGYVASRGALLALQPGSRKSTWQACGSGGPRAPVYRRCAKFSSPAGCNWLVAAGVGGKGVQLCQACALNQCVPDLSRAGDLVLWTRMEMAKRRLVSQLIGLGLPVVSKVRDDPARGLAFDFPSPLPGGPRVLTGHGNGVITINLDEADDPVRERTRQEMGEPYRTLLGHFRHEVGHYYWDRLVADTHWLTPCRALFGDERLSYGLALKMHYQQGPPPDWRTTFVSGYASMHPWEDWAETWAHYLHVRDTLDTAFSHGIRAQAQGVQAQPFGREDLWKPADLAGDSFLDMLHAWIEVTAVMNEMSAAMGHQDYYPFVLPRAAVAKLHFIHCVVSQARQDTPALDPVAVMAAANASARAPRRRTSGPKVREGAHGAH